MENMAAAITESKVVGAANLLAVELFSRLSQNSGNVFYSPWSLSCALAMTYAGAKEGTADQLEKVLHFSDLKSSVHPAMRELNQKMKNLNTGNNQIKVANRLWIQSGVSVLDDFMETLTKGYEVKSELLNFADAETARSLINKWVEEQTNRKIKDLIAPGVLNALTRLVITNAVYFKGQWKTPFDANLTRPLPFHVNSSEEVTVPMMYLKTKKDCYYTETNELQVLSLPYQGDGIRMVIILPRKSNSITALENTVTSKPSVLSTWMDADRVRREICITVPKFKIIFAENLKGILQSLGMTDLFSEANADLSGITGSQDLFVSDILQKAFVEVNEEGTEAAAATVVVMAPGCAMPRNEEPLIFCADHPFLFLITDVNTKLILFMGKVTNPKI